MNAFNGLESLQYLELSELFDLSNLKIYTFDPMSNLLLDLNMQYIETKDNI
jgi:hypothetical protein